MLMKPWLYCAFCGSAMKWMAHATGFDRVSGNPIEVQEYRCERARALGSPLSAPPERGHDFWIVGTLAPAGLYIPETVEIIRHVP